MKMQTLFRFLMMASGLAFLVSGSWSCQGTAEVPEILRPVRYEAVYATGGNRSRIFSGVARAGIESRLSFKVSGTIDKLPVKVGDRVKENQLIAELDPSDYRLQRQQAQASLESARATERNASANYDRVTRLYENRSVSLNELDAARASFESARAQVQALQKQLQLAQLQVGYTKLKAPVAGAIADVLVEINENVGSGQSVVKLTSGSQMEVSVAIPGVLISQVREGQNVSVSSDAMPNANYPAKVVEVGVASSESSTTFPVTVRLVQEDTGLKSGMSTEVKFDFDSAGNLERMIVPPFSVLEDGNGQFVFTLEASDETGVGIVKRKSVTIGNLVETGLIITDGLKDGDRLITAGVSKLRDGQRVSFNESAEAN